MKTGATSQVKSTVTNVKNEAHDVSPSTVNVVEHAPVVKGKHSCKLDFFKLDFFKLDFFKVKVYDNTLKKYFW